MNKYLTLSCFMTFIFSFYGLAAQTYTNPIIPGSFPDPSICRVDDHYYIVNSSFEYFPALPIHKSNDLINWELIGYGLDHSNINSSINLYDVQQEGGIHAPSIRYNKGLYYVVSTNVYNPLDSEKNSQMVNFIITANDPRGPWSSPHVINNAPGIDPDIFFDDNGRVWFVGTHAPGDMNADGIGEIWVQELDLKNWKLIGSRYTVWAGACGGCCVEGPHIYKRKGKYYLMVAEGGTSRNHSVMIAISDSINGLFESNPKNPILTSRHLSNDNWVNSTGHGDLVELSDGSWAMVCLGIRNEINGASNMGRETFLMPVEWQETTLRWVEKSQGVWRPLIYELPVVSPSTGRVDKESPLIIQNTYQNTDYSFFDDFLSDDLKLEWNFRRVPKDKIFSLKERKGFLRLHLDSQNFGLRKQYSLIGLRQRETSFSFSAKMHFIPLKDGEESGISIFQKDDAYIKFTVLRKSGVEFLSLVRESEKFGTKVLKVMELKAYNGNISLSAESVEGVYNFKFSLNNRKGHTDFYKVEKDALLSHGYTGAYLGLYGSTNFGKGKSHSDFDWVNIECSRKVN